MNLYKLTQDSVTGYDTYDSCVVCALSEIDARTIHPAPYEKGIWWEKERHFSPTWPTDLSKISTEFIGIAVPSLSRGVICASFNAG